MARAIWGSARFTAWATVASSALMSWAMSREDLRSRSLAARFGCSVLRRRRVDGLRFKFGAFRDRKGWFILTAGGRGGHLVSLRHTLSLLRGLLVARSLTHGLRRGLHSCAALRLSWLRRAELFSTLF